MSSSALIATKWCASGHLPAAAIAACWMLTLSGCSMAMALHGHPEPNFDNIQVGASREDVEAEFGKPVFTKELEGGKREETYQYEMGNSPNPGRAAVYGYAWLTIIGILGEPIYSLIELFQGHDEETKVVYDAESRVLAVAGYRPLPPSKALQTAEEAQSQYVKSRSRSGAPRSESISAQNAEAIHMSLNTKFRELARRLSTDLKDRRVIRIAVLPVQDALGKHDKPFANYATEKLTAKLHEEGAARVVERSQLDKVTQELALTRTGSFDEDTAMKIGRLLGVEAIVTTLYADLGSSSVEISAKVVSVETGEIIGVGSIAVPRAIVERMLP